MATVNEMAGHQVFFFDFLEEPKHGNCPRQLNNITSTIIPIGSMYGIYTNIGGILMVNVTIYGIHGSYGIYYQHMT